MTYRPPFRLRSPMSLDFTPDPVGAGFDIDRLRRIDEHLRTRYLDPGKIVACQVLVARGGRVAHRSTLGTMDLGTVESLADQAIWRWYSMTKPVTGVALLTLVERGMVKLVDPVDRFLPEWRDAKVGVPRSDGGSEDGEGWDLVEPERPMRVRDALMHMTGIGPGPAGARLNLAAMADGGPRRSLPPGTTLADLSAMLAKEPLRFHPG